MQLSALISALGRFVSELQRRKVLRVASLYVVTGWIVLQVSLALQSAMALPASFSTVIVSLLIVGLPVALVASWFFDFTPEGIKRTVASGDGALVKPQTTDWILIGLLVIVAGVTILQAVMPRASAPAATTAAAEAPKPKPEPPALGDKSIAVLPFVNLSQDKENEYFADGLADEILNVLAQIRGLKVVSRTSSFAFKGQATSLPDIAKRLGVRHVLEGSVRRNGDEIRVTAQLIDVATDVHLWSQVFERKLADVFVVQDDIARAIAGALNIEVSVSAAGRAAPTANLEAYRQFLNARELYFRRRDGDVLESAALYKRATELDPKFAEAYAGLASAYAVLSNASAQANAVFSPKVIEAANKALVLKPNVGRAYGALATLARTRLDWESAIANYSKAMALDSSDSLAVSGLGATFLLAGKFDEGNRYINDAKRIDPIYNVINVPTLMFSAFVREDDDTFYTLAAAVLASRGSVTATANARAFARGALIVQARAKRDYATAEKHFRAMMRSIGRSEPLINAVVPALKSRAAFDSAEKALLAEAVRDPKFEPEPVFLSIGDESAYFDALAARLARGDKVRTLAWLPYMWRAYALSDDARAKFKNLVHAVGLVDYWKKHGWPDQCRPKGEDDFECS